MSVMHWKSMGAGTNEDTSKPTIRMMVSFISATSPDLVAHLNVHGLIQRELIQNDELGVEFIALEGVNPLVVELFGIHTEVENEARDHHGLTGLELLRSFQDSIEHSHFSFSVWD